MYLYPSTDPKFHSLSSSFVGGLIQGLLRAEAQILAGFAFLAPTKY